VNVRHYYNEFDPKAAAWLRDLMEAGLIPEGTVDERSITEVQPADLVGYVQCHFFAGIGGWPQALRLAGWPTDRRVWTGSCPCQPFSTAGKRKGKEDERHLWPVWFELLRGYNAISQREPVPVFGEQVASAIRHGWLDGVCTDLEGEGYTCGHAVLGAHSVGSPHIRQRLFWVANPQHNGSHGSERPGNIPPMEQLQRREEEQASVQQFTTSRNGGGMVQPNGNGRKQGWPTTKAARYRGAAESTGSGVGESFQSRLEGLTGNVGNGDESRRIVADEAGSTTTTGTISGMAHPGYSTASTKQGNELQERDSGIRQPGHWDDYDLIPCRDGKTRRVKSGVRCLAHGIPGRVAQLRGLGNAIVPACAAEFIQAYMQTEHALTPSSPAAGGG
jgi:DNA (cytosine-5)-methyltransferase 1